MRLFVIFKNSLLLPRNKALFYLNRVSVMETIVYMGCLMFFLFLPYIVKLIVNMEKTVSELPNSIYLFQIIVFYPFFILFFIVGGVSLLAVLSLGMNWLLKRKLTYQHLWKMTAYALTWPLIIYSVLILFEIRQTAVTLLPLVFCYTLLYRMILVYPKIG